MTVNKLKLLLVVIIFIFFLQPVKATTAITYSIEVLVPSNLNVVLWGVQNVATGGWGNTATNVWKRPTTELGSGSWVFPNDILWSTGVVSRFSLHQQNVCDWTLTFCRYTSYFPSPTMPQAASGLESPPWIGDN